MFFSPHLQPFLLSYLHIQGCFDWKTRAADRQTDRQTSDQPEGRRRQTETQTRASLFHKHTVMLQLGGTRHGKCLHHSIFSAQKKRKANRGAGKLPPPASQTLSAVTSILAFSFRPFYSACVWEEQCFLMHADGLVWKGLSHYSPVVNSERRSLWVWFSCHLPPRACFPFYSKKKKNKPDFLRNLKTFKENRFGHGTNKPQKAPTVHSVSSSLILLF